MNVFPVQVVLNDCSIQFIGFIDLGKKDMPGKIQKISAAERIDSHGYIPL